MRLKSLTLTNFEGIKYLEIIADGKSLSIYGDNGTGKTTIADAQTWLLFDKDSQLTSNFSPQMRNASGEDIHNIDCSVKAVYEVNGTAVTLEKVLKEDWKKKRGSIETVFSGHKITYFIDGVPKKEKEYIEYLNSVCDIQKLILLSLPEYFPEIIDIKKRREILMSLVGSVSDFDVIDSNEELKPLLHMTLKPNTTQVWYSIDEYLKICKSKGSEINTELKEIPGRIDEVARQIVDFDIDVNALKTELSKLSAYKTTLQIELNKTSNEMILSLRESIANEKVKLSEAEKGFSERYRKINDSIFDKINGLNNQKSESQKKLYEIESSIFKEEQQLQTLRSNRENLMKKISELQSKTWQGDTVCPACGQELPVEQIESAKEQFNLNKSKELEEVNAYGKEHCSASMIADCENLIAELKSDKDKLSAVISQIDKDIESATEEVQTAPLFSSTSEYKQINNTIEGMKAQIQLLEQSENGKKDDIRNQISDVDIKINIINVKLAEYEASEKARNRIAELEEKQVQLGEAFAKAQKGIYLCELFSRTKADMLTNKINEKFKNVRFRLFKQQINGGIADDCEVMANTSTGYMPYSTANNAARISAGLDIIRTFSEAWNVQLPVFVDNAESITNLDTNGLQIIRLVVSENDKKLRIEEEI